MSSKRERARRETRRRFEQWARNPECHANVISAVHNVKMGAVARKENPSAPREGQSVFALSRGLAFENSLVRDNGAVLLDTLIASGVLPNDAGTFIDHRISVNGGPLRDLDDAIDQGNALLANLAANKQPPGAISSFTVRIPRGIMLPEAILIIDVLAIRHSEGCPVLEVGEVKTYADLGGHTSRSDLATARAQMGLYVHALEVSLDQLGLTGKIDVSRSGFLVLTYPGSNQPSVRSGEDLRYQLERARRGFELMEESAKLMNGEYGSGDGDDPDELLDLVLHAETSFQDSCVSFCERADACFQIALEAGRGAALGDDMERFLNGISLNRAEELLKGAAPASAVERDFLIRSRDPLPELP
jgi:hypothetical protein